MPWTPTTGRSVDSLFRAPFEQIYSALKAVKGEADLDRPLGYGLRLSGVSQKMVYAGVVSLLTGRRPMAVAWLVIAVVIFAVNGMLIAWCAAHIGQKLLELNPSVAHLYASTAIASICFVFLVMAAFFHVTPHAMLKRAAFSVSDVWGSAEPASTFWCSDSGDDVDKVFEFYAANTPTQTSRPAPVCDFEHRQTAIGLSDFHHVWNSIVRGSDTQWESA